MQPEIILSVDYDCEGHPFEDGWYCLRYCDVTSRSFLTREEAQTYSNQFKLEIDSLTALSISKPSVT